MLLNFALILVLANYDNSDAKPFLSNGNFAKNITDVSPSSDIKATVNPPLDVKTTKIIHILNQTLGFTVTVTNSSDPIVIFENENTKIYQTLENLENEEEETEKDELDDDNPSYQEARELVQFLNQVISSLTNSIQTLGFSNYLTDSYNILKELKIAYGVIRLLPDDLKVVRDNLLYLFNDVIKSIEELDDLYYQIVNSETFYEEEKNLRVDKLMQQQHNLIQDTIQSMRRLLKFVFF